MEEREAAAGVFEPELPYDLTRTLQPVRRGGADPCFRVLSGEIWRATRTPSGPGTERLRTRADGAVEVAAWGPGARWLVEHAPVLLGGQDDASRFQPAHPLLRDLHRRYPGLRIPRTEAVFEAAMATIVEQKVPGVAAWRSWRAIVRTLGDPAPGPAPGLFVPPAPEVVARTSYFALHPLGLERRRAETLRRAAAASPRLAEALGMPLDAARRRLTAVPGLGPWSAAEIALVALGDADAVSVGDYHLPHQVSWALAGEPRGSDERMLELLEPYRGHRGRVLRLLFAAGIQAPRHGPRLPLHDVARM
jgi:3-methyladenine DNA glycosylase/8-oxoguanine DNA glycosylase